MKGAAKMQQEDLVQLIKDIQFLKSEKQTVELKSANGGFPKKIYDTLSAFSNQDSGGIIIFGVTDQPDYQIIGVYDADDVQKKIMENCQQMEPPLRAVTTICEIEGKIVVAAEVPGVELSRRPVYYAGTGITKGSFVRVGDGDRHMTPYEIYSYEAFRKQIRDELRTMDRMKIQLFDQDRLEKYLQAVKSDRRNLSVNVSDDDILELMGVTYDGKPTLAGVMTFSKYPQTFFPQLSITAVAVPGTEMGVTGLDGERFIDNKRITGAIPEMLEDAVDFVRRNSRTKTIIGDDGQRHDKSEYPMKAIREAILNALVHRDYSIYTEGTPVSIEMYRDRIEIKNSGGLYDYATLDELGKSRPETRNPALANMLELLKVTENRYSGIPKMIAETKIAGLPAPEFQQRRGEFTVTFRNNIFEINDTEKSQNTFLLEDKAAEQLNIHRGLSLQQSILEFCEKPRTRAEILEFTGMSRFHVMSKYVFPLIETGLLAFTLPDKPKSSKQQFVTVRNR